MKSDRIKKIVLVILLLPLIYIWWGNIDLFTQKTKYTYTRTSDTSKNNIRSIDRSEIVYKSPQVNPFYHKEKESKLTVPSSNMTKSEPEVPKSLIPRYSVSGIVAKKEQSQAIIKLPDNRTSIVTIGDSLEAWEVVAIDGQRVIFKCNNIRDTLWLGDAIFQNK